MNGYPQTTAICYTKLITVQSLSLVIAPTMFSRALITELASSTDNPVRIVFESDRIVRPT